jgi:hypothetical protein
MMKRIYDMAEAVVVWLAEHEGLERGSVGMKAALEVLAEEAEQMAYFEDMAKDSDVACKIRTWFLERLHELVAADDTFLPWLEAQEFISARKILIQYGESTVDY